VLSDSRTGSKHSVTGAKFRLIRLAADGSLDRRFGRDGIAAFGLLGLHPFVTAAATRGGGLYLGGDGCCGSDPSGYVARVSAKGRLDRRFTAASRRSLRGLADPRTVSEGLNAVVVRPGGKIDLLGSAGLDRGFMLRLNASGHPHRSFGRNGTRTLAVPVAAAALGSDGAVLATSDQSRQGAAVLVRILAGGRPDPAFGSLGMPIPDSRGDVGVSVVAQAGRKALVLDLGLRECRFYCPATPKLARFLEGPRPSGR
jgi:hypothetical protein